MNLLLALSLLWNLMLDAEKWCNNDITNASGHTLDTLTSSAGCKQIINKSIHTVNNSFSCIGLIFCNNLNII